MTEEKTEEENISNIICVYNMCVYTYDPYDTISKKLGLIIINFPLHYLEL